LRVRIKLCGLSESWETYNAGLKEEHNHEHGETTPVRTGGSASVDTDGCGDEDHDQGLEEHEDDTGLAAKVHETSSCETTGSEETLGNGVEVGSLDVGFSDIEIRAGLLEVVDEVGSNTDLGTDVGELGKGTPEESVLLAEWLVDVSGSGSSHLSLIGHIRVGDFRNGSKVEYDGKNSDESSNTKVDPLHGLEGATICADILEDDLSSEDGSNDGTNSLNGLGQLETELGPLGRTADSNVRVGRDFESRQSRTSKEHGTAETSKASLDSRRPEHECADTVDGQAKDEGVSVSKLAQEPSRVSKRADEVGTKVRGLET
jgi:hypothetical protein